MTARSIFDHTIKHTQNLSTQNYPGYELLSFLRFNHRQTVNTESMTQSKRVIKENQIIAAAEKVFARSGFRHAKMEDVAQEVGVSKGTVYFYFKSKENLYMALTYTAYKSFIDHHYELLESLDDKNGFESLIAFFDMCLNFAEKNHYQYDLIIQYINLIRSSAISSEEPQSVANLRSSIYFRKIQDIQYIPLNIVVEKIKEGQKDGSILNHRNPAMLYLTLWSIILGFSSLNTTNTETNRQTILKVPITEWRSYVLHVVQDILHDRHEGTYVNKVSIPEGAELR